MYVANENIEGCSLIAFEHYIWREIMIESATISTSCQINCLNEYGNKSERDLAILFDLEFDLIKSIII